MINFNDPVALTAMVVALIAGIVIGICLNIIFRTWIYGQHGQDLRELGRWRAHMVEYHDCLGDLPEINLVLENLEAQVKGYLITEPGSLKKRKHFEMSELREQLIQKQREQEQRI